MKRILAIIAALSLAAHADEGRVEQSVSTSNTSARSGALGIGYKLVRCTVATHYRTGNSSVTATTNDMVIPALTGVTIYITGTENYLAFILPSSTGSCSIYPRQTGPNGQIPAYAAATPVNSADITPSSVTTTTLTVSGFTSGGDAGFHNVVLSGASTVAGYTGGQDAGYHNIVASGNVGGPAWAITSAGLISGDTPITAGAFPSMFIGTGAAVVEGVDGLGPYQPSQLGRASRVGRVCCSCRVAGSGGSDGIFIALMEDGLEVASVKVVGADSNACDDTARTRLCGNIATTLSQESVYTGQFKSTTDCAGNPTDCVCNFEILR